MAEISNKTLVGLLVVAIVISLAGTFISLNKLGQLGVTGLQTSNVTQQAGTTSVTLLSTYQLTIYNNSVIWGSGQVNGSVSPGIDVCNLTTDGAITSSGNAFAFTGAGKTTACDGFAGTTPWSMVLENTGSSGSDFTNVTMAATNGDADFKTKFDASAQFLWRLEEEDNTNACGASPGETSTYTTVATAATEICRDFQAAPNTEDAFMIQLRMDIPENSTADTFTDTLTFVGVI